MQWENDKALSVLFVCLGNICRSPMAEGALRAAALARGLKVDVDSVGTASYHIGDKPDPRAISIAARHGTAWTYPLCEADNSLRRILPGSRTLSR